MRLQLARFGTQCRLFAPMYRQLTLAAVGRANAAGIESPDFLAVGYQDVRAAWRYYLAHDNGNRGIVLIGHSQGTVILTELLRKEIDGARRCSHASSPRCSSADRGHPRAPREGRGRHLCAYAALSRGHADRLRRGVFIIPQSPRRHRRARASGRSADSTLVAACTNPAALGGGEAALNGYFDAAGRTALPFGPSDPWTVGGRPIATPMVRVVGLLKGQCRSNAFASYLEVSVERGPGSPASRDIQGDLAEPLGLHLVDMEVAMGNLVDLVGQQTTSYLGRTRRP